jgi:hypothetical protein
MTDIRKFAIGELVMIKPSTGQRLGLTSKQYLANVISTEDKGLYTYLCLNIGDGSKLFVPSFDVAKATQEVLRGKQSWIY